MYSETLKIELKRVNFIKTLNGVGSIVTDVQREVADSDGYYPICYLFPEKSKADLDIVIDDLYVEYHGCAADPLEGEKVILFFSEKPDFYLKKLKEEIGIWGDIPSGLENNMTMRIINV